MHGTISNTGTEVTRRSTCVRFHRSEQKAIRLAACFTCTALLQVRVKRQGRQRLPGTAMAGKRKESNDGEVLGRKKAKKGMPSTNDAEPNVEVWASPVAVACTCQAAHAYACVAHTSVCFMQHSCAVL